MSSLPGSPRNLGQENDDAGGKKFAPYLLPRRQFRTADDNMEAMAIKEWGTHAEAEGASWISGTEPEIEVKYCAR